MIPNVINALKKLASKRQRRLLDIAYEVAAGHDVDAAQVDAALQEAGMAPEAFSSLVANCKRRADARRELANERELETEKARLAKEIERHQKKLEEAERVFEEAVAPLDSRFATIRKRLSKMQFLRTSLYDYCPDLELQAEYDDARARLSFVAARLPRVRRNLETMPRAAASDVGDAAFIVEENYEKMQEELKSLEAEAPKLKARLDELERRIMEA